MTHFELSTAPAESTPAESPRDPTLEATLEATPLRFAGLGLDAVLFLLMGYRRTPFAIDERFHCYNRGVDKRTVFETADEFQRFLQLLYMANDTKPLVRPLFEHLVHEQVFDLPRKSPLVAIGAYCLMPNHIHLFLREIIDGGITRFMHKLGTGYTLYFNYRHERVGNLFVKPFRSRHVHDDRYMQHVVNYIHLNPAELFEPQWKQGIVRDMKKLGKKMNTYTYSSFPEYGGVHRPESAILDRDEFDFLRSQEISMRQMLLDAHMYYQEASEMLEKLR